jgi:hypothetical protein
MHIISTRTHMWSLSSHIVLGLLSFESQSDKVYNQVA